MTEQTAQQSGQLAGPEVNLQRIYIKDLSFESPRAPVVFKEQSNPKMTFELNIFPQPLEEEALYEVVLALSVHVNNEVNNESKTAFLIEVKQAGIFTIKNAAPEQLDHILRSFCPQILYPYAREAVSDLAARGSFPQLLLAPIYFDGLYVREKADRAEAAKSTVQ